MKQRLPRSIQSAPVLRTCKAAMGRNRGPKPSSPLAVAATSITRALDPIDPSRATLLRLMSDALRLLEETSEAAEKAARAAEKDDTASTSKSSAKGKTGAGQKPSPVQRHLVVMSAATVPPPGYTKSSYVAGLQAIAASAFTCLMRMTTRCGPLRRRAVLLLRRAAEAGAGAIFLAQAARDARAHIASIRKPPQTNKAAFEAEIASALLVLAEASDASLAGTGVASDSFLFMLGPKLKQKVSRSDAAMAAAQILSSFNSRYCPDSALVDKAVEFATASASTKLGVGGIGSALLAGAVAPYMRARGQASCKALANSSSRALAAAPTPSEKNAWAVAVARSCVAFYQAGIEPDNDRGYSLLGGKASEPSTSAKHSSKSVQDPGAVFEDSLVMVSKLCGLGSEHGGCVWAVAAVLHIWASEHPAQTEKIAARALHVLQPDMQSSASIALLREALHLGLADHWKPGHGPMVFRSLLDLPCPPQSYAQALCLFFAADVIDHFGLDVRLTLSVSDTVTGRVLSTCYAAMSANFSTVRFGGVALLCAIANLAPHLRAPLVTTVLQSVQIADLQLAAKPPPPGTASQKQHLVHVAEELSALLGSTAGLASLIGRSYEQPLLIPSALLHQCANEAEALLSGHPVSHSANPHGIAVACVRRRAGWALLTALARSKYSACFEPERLQRLTHLWRRELGQQGRRGRDTTYGGKREAHEATGTASRDDSASQDFADFAPSGVDIEEITTGSTTRSAALAALAECLRVTNSVDFRAISVALLGATAARIAVAAAGIAPLGSSGSAFISLVQAVASAAAPAVAGAEGAHGKLGPSDTATTKTSGLRSHGHRAFKPGQSAEDSHRARAKTVARLCVVEALGMLNCIQLAAPTGTSAELCYHVAAAVGDEAQRALGDSAGTLAAGGSVSQGVSNPQDFGFLSSCAWGVEADGFVMISRRVDPNQRRAGPSVASSNLLHAFRYSSENAEAGFASSDIAAADDVHGPVDHEREHGDLLWLFSTDGYSIPAAERALTLASEAIASLIACELRVSATLLESLVLSSSLSPAFSATLSLALARRLSATDFSATGRALASIQVLLRRALTGVVVLPSTSAGTSAVQAAAAMIGGGGTEETIADTELARCRYLPGCELELQVGRLGWQEWARSFSLELAHGDDGGRSVPSQVFGVSQACRNVSARAYRILAEKGGTPLWLGLVRNVTETLKTSVQSSACSQVSLTATAVCVIGALLEAVPASSMTLSLAEPLSIAETFGPGTSGSIASDVDAAVRDAIEAVLSAMAHESSYVRASAAASLSDSAQCVATYSERIMAQLYASWASDRSSGELSEPRAKLLEDAELSRVCLKSAEKGMSQGDVDAQFFRYSIQGPGSCRSAAGMGAAAVLSACRQHYWHFSEACVGAAGDVSAELMHWDSFTSPLTVAAGLYGLSSLWAARIDFLLLESETAPISSTTTRSPKQAASPGPMSPRSSPFQIPLVSPMVQVGAYLDDMNGHDRLGNSAPVFPSGVFVVADTPIASTLARIATCLRISGNYAELREVRSAAVAAITQFVRGVGPVVALKTCPELPEALFAALDGDAASARRLLQRLAELDGPRRFGFWTRLCVGVFRNKVALAVTGGPQDKKEPRPPSSRTRGVAVMILREAAEAALVAGGRHDPHRPDRSSTFTPGETPFDDYADVSKREESEGDARSLPECLPTLCELAAEAAMRVDINARAAEEGCKLLECVVRVLDSAEGAWPCNEPWLLACIPTISKALLRTLQEDCPPFVVRGSARAVSRLLASRAYCTQEDLSARVDREVLHALCSADNLVRLWQKYKFEHYAEHVGAETVLGVLGEVAYLFLSHWHRQPAEAAQTLVAELEVAYPALRAILLAVLGDFATILGDGVGPLATLGGSITPPDTSFAELERLFTNCISPIVFAAAALCQPPPNMPCTHESIPWLNDQAPGVLLLQRAAVDGPEELLRLTLAVTTWLLCQQQASSAGRNEYGPALSGLSVTRGSLSLSSIDQVGLLRHAVAALPPLLLNPILDERARIEALLALSRMDGMAAVRVSYELVSGTRSPHLDPTWEPSMGILSACLDVCLEELCDHPSRCDLGQVCRALWRLLDAVGRHQPRTEYAERVLESVLALLNQPLSVKLKLLGRRTVQSQISRTMVACLTYIEGTEAVVQTMQRLSSTADRLRTVDATDRLCAVMAAVVALDAHWPVECVGVIQGLVLQSDEVADAVLVCDGGPEFWHRALSSPSAQSGGTPSSVPVGRLFAVLVRRSAHGCGHVGRAGVSVLYFLWKNAQTTELAEAVYSALFAILARKANEAAPETRDMLCSLAGADDLYKANLRRLSEYTRANVEKAVYMQRSMASTSV